MVSQKVEPGVQVSQLQISQPGVPSSTDGQTAEAFVEGAVSQSRIIGMDIHDGPLQTVLYARQELERLRKSIPPENSDALRALDGIVSQLRNATEELRAMAGASMGMASTKDLVSALLDLASLFRQRFAGPLDVHVAGTPRDVDPRRRMHLLRLVQEALNNGCKHAEATHIALEISFSTEEIAIHIRDNGQGIDESSGDTKGFGLPIMKRRAAEIGGSLTVESSRHGGTTVAVHFPG